MADPARIVPPNYTQIPNVVLDLMADMSDAELRVVLAIARQTFGWHKKRDKISLSQLQKLTGMSRQGVIDGLSAGVRREVIERIPDEQDRRGGIWYRLLVNEVDQSSTLTSSLNDQSTSLTRTSQRTRPELVNVLDTQKKDKEKKETSSTDGGDGRHVSYLLDNNMGAAKEFADLDSDTAIRDFDNRRKAGQSQAHIVRAWRAKRPTPDSYFGRPPPPNGASPPPPKTDTVSSKRLAEMTKDIPL